MPAHKHPNTPTSSSWFARSRRRRPGTKGFIRLRHPFAIVKSRSAPRINLSQQRIRSRAGIKKSFKWHHNHYRRRTVHSSAQISFEKKKVVFFLFRRLRLDRNPNPVSALRSRVTFKHKIHPTVPFCTCHCGNRTFVVKNFKKSADMAFSLRTTLVSSPPLGPLPLSMEKPEHSPSRLP